MTENEYKTARHALQYLRRAQRVSEAKSVTPTEALRNIGRSVRTPCRAIGEAKTRLRAVGGDVDKAISSIQRHIDAEYHKPAMPVSDLFRS